MAKITKYVSRNIPTTERYQYWNTQEHTNDEGTSIAPGDVFHVYESLGRVAKQMLLTTASGSVSFRRNIEETYFPIRPANLFGGIAYDNINQGVTVSGETENAIIVPANSSYAFNGTPIKTIEVVTMSGAFTLEVS